MTRQIIGLVGLIGSGKNSVANFLSNDYGFKQISFASSLKDAVAAIFGWPRHLLEGDTDESREFREKVDQAWQDSIGNIELLQGRKVTPRLILQLMGTEVLRKNFHYDIWVLSVIRKIEAATNTSYVVTDVRFKNEMKMLENIGAKIVRVKRGNDPIWFETAKFRAPEMPTLYPEVHQSEWDWVSSNPSIVIENNGTLEDLKSKTLELLK
jgi:hypothetical protein